MQKHKCKLCSKSFCNGRALGGHMKSHLVSSSQSPNRKKLADSVHSSSSSSDGKSLVYALRENPRKSFRVMNPDPELSTVLYDSETETEPESEDPVRKRSRAQVSKKKTKKSKKLKTSHYNSIESPEPASSISDGSPEQDLAMCLMMLSRDSRELQIINPMIKPEETTKPEKRRCPELRRCVIDLNLPPPQESEVASVVSAI